MLVHFAVENTTCLQVHGVQGYHRIVCEAGGIDLAWYQGAITGKIHRRGRPPSNVGIHVCLPALLAALRALGDAPARSLTALAQRLGISEADAATLVVPLAEGPPLWRPSQPPCRLPLCP